MTIEHEPTDLAPTIGRLFHVPVDIATTPLSGECVCDKWWVVHPTLGLAFYYVPIGHLKSDAPAPQCNDSEHVARLLCEHLSPDHVVEFFPVVFLQHAEKAMKELRAAHRKAL